MKRVQKFRPSSVDKETLVYLRNVYSFKGKNHIGYFIPQTTWTSWFFCILGGILVLLSFICIPTMAVSYAWEDFVWIPGLFLAGMLFFTPSLHTIIVRRSKHYLGDFHFVDSNFYWEVTPHKIKATNISDAVGLLEVCNHYYNGAYTHTIIKIEFADRKIMDFTVHGIDPAKAIAAFIVLSIQNREQNNGAALENTPMPQGPQASIFDIRPRLLIGSFLLSLCVACLGFPDIGRYLYEEKLYTAACMGGATDVSSTDTYCDFYPNGRHIKEIKELRDIRRFHLAKEKLETQNQIRYMREYIANKENTRFQDEASTALSNYFDTVLLRLEEASKQNTNKDPRLFDALITILRSVRGQVDPTIYVTFASSYQDTPENEILEAEKEIIDEYIETSQELKSLKLKGKEVLVPYGNVFSKKQNAHREELILKRLDFAFQSVLGCDILKFRKNKDIEAPINSIKITYDIYPSGSIFTYTISKTISQKTYNDLPIEEETRLLREYLISWQLEIIQDAEPYILDIDTKPSDFEIRTEAFDPEWAPYAIMLYTAFHDFSKKLTEEFGIPPRLDMPAKFSFKDAAVYEY